MAIDQRSIRYKIVFGLVLAISAVLVFILIKLQLMDPYYSDKAKSITLNQNIIQPSRGLFYDRNGKLLVINYPAYDIYVNYNKISKDLDTNNLCFLLNIPKHKFSELIEKDWSSGKFSKSIPFVMLKNVDATTFLRFQENNFRFPGFSGSLRAIREYPIAHGANFLGYTSEVKKFDIDQNKDVYKLGDYKGEAGIEKKYENYIRGSKGLEFTLRDNLGREVGPYMNGKLDRDAISGSDVHIAIDIELQKLGDSLLMNKVGSIVAIEPASGELLCMNTSPTFDPNLLSINQTRGQAYAYLLRDTLKPLFDRSSQAVYPPGSIFKPILGLIALQEGIINENTPHACSGAYYYKSFSYGCHNHPAPYKLSVALQHSCNSYFFQTFRDFIDQDGSTKPSVGLDKLVKYLTEFGLGRPLFTDVDAEKSGFIPTSDFYTRLYKTNQWRSTYIISVGIGQGELQLTTIQMANLAAIIANKGYYIPPHLVKGFSPNNILIPEIYRTKNYVPVDQKHFKPVIDGMELAVSSGTATLAFHPDLQICGKTGTSQNSRGKDHSVFFAFAPKDNPKIAIAVYVENAGWGGAVAAPIASLMIEKYLKGTILRKELEERMKKKDLISTK
ncbi:MAG: penicillin-binding protein 2 [Saprospiraceae bacterium]|nr:penicillin-binding protein 2 [Saprospiraceae bacterium]MBK9993755.1 penicillin-binding protein 2 [Saprospiraceae bacterium]